MGLILERVADHVRVVEALATQAETIRRIAIALVTALRAGRKVLAFGNGGSAADAEQLVAELVGRYCADRVALPAIALTTNTSTLTAIANDYDCASVFVRQVQALGQPGDVAVGISTSGRPPKVVEALRLARKLGLTTVALTGAGGTHLQGLADLCLCVASSDTARVQEAHILPIHCVCELVERAWTAP